MPNAQARTRSTIRHVPPRRLFRPPRSAHSVKLHDLVTKLALEAGASYAPPPRHNAGNRVISAQEKDVIAGFGCALSLLIACIHWLGSWPRRAALNQFHCLRLIIRSSSSRDWNACRLFGRRHCEQAVRGFCKNTRLAFGQPSSTILTQPRRPSHGLEVVVILASALKARRRRGRPRYCLPSCPSFIVPTTGTPIGPTGIYTSVWLGELTIFCCA